MTALFDTLLAMFVLGLTISIVTLGTVLVVSIVDRRSRALPRAVVRLR